MKDTGTLKLTAVRKHSRTIITNCYYQGALKITRPIYVDKWSPVIYLMHVGGGYVDGDSYRIKFGLEQGAHLLVTTQASTKVYRTPYTPVTQHTEITLKKGSILEYFPDPLIAYEGAKFVQETSIFMEEGSTVIFSDMITPGWSRDGSLFKFEWITSKFKVFHNDHIVLFDHIFLKQDDKITDILKMEGYSHIGSLFIINDKINKQFAEKLYGHIKEMEELVRFGVSILPITGCVIRILGNCTGDVENVINAAHSIVRQELLHKEPIQWRKY